MSAELLKKLLLLLWAALQESVPLFSQVCSLPKDPGEGHAKETLLWESLRGANEEGGEIHVSSREPADVGTYSPAWLCKGRAKVWGKQCAHLQKI